MLVDHYWLADDDAYSYHGNISLSLILNYSDVSIKLVRLNLINLA